TNYLRAKNLFGFYEVFLPLRRQYFIGAGVERSCLSCQLFAPTFTFSLLKPLHGIRCSSANALETIARRVSTRDRSVFFTEVGVAYEWTCVGDGRRWVRRLESRKSSSRRRARCNDLRCLLAARRA